MTTTTPADLRRREAVLCMEARDDRTVYDTTRRRWLLNRLRRQLRQIERTGRHE